MAPYKILKQGYMMKEPPVSRRGIRKKVVRYWFVLVEDRTQVALVYFKTEDAYIARQKNEGFIRVDQASSISVVGEHMGHKNAFFIRTPKGEFHLLPGSRYDLHEWLFTLHNGMENFKKRMQKTQERRQSQQHSEERTEQIAEGHSEGEQPRPRANTAETQQPRPRTNTAESQQPRLRANTAEGEQPRPRENTPEKHHTKPSATAGHTPPYRRAPPPPRERPQRRRPNREDRVAANASVNGGGKMDSNSPRKKPVRPAPVAPGGRRHNSSSSGGPALSQEVPISPNNLFGNEMTSPIQLSLPPLTCTGRSRTLSQEGYGTMESDRDGYSTMESGQHVIVDLNISQTEREPLSSGGEDMSSPLHTRSASDSLLLMHQVSSSLPEMLNEIGDSTSPETMEEAVEGKKKNGELPPKSPNHGYRHTRHLSLLGGSKKEGGGCHAGRSRKKPKRGGSMKQRSRSPPNLPPPPPPPTEPSMERSPEPFQDHNLQHSDGKGMTHASASEGSVGFSEVLNTISDIDQQLNNIAENFTTTTTVITPSQPPSHPPPPPPIQMERVTLTFGQANLGPSPIPFSPSSNLPQGPSPVPEETEQENGEFREEDWMCDIPPGQTNQTDSSSRSHDTQLPNQVIPTSPPVSMSSDLTNEVTVEKPTRRQHHVMFKEEVEAIPNYEPRVDQEGDQSTSSSDEETEIDEVPVGVAAIKMKLFGRQEQEVTRYKKEGVLCPKHTHPENMTFSEHYFDTNVMETNHDGAQYDRTHYDPTPTGNALYNHDMNILGHHDNANNNNSEEESVVSELVSSSASNPVGDTGKGEGMDKPTMDGSHPISPATVANEKGGRRETPKHNVYESPWDEKPISKYKVIGIVRRAASPPGAGGQVKEKTPPPVAPKQMNSSVQRIHYAEVSMKETPKPFATEVRNVHSLERKLLKKGGQQLSPPTSPPTHISPPSTSMSNDENSLLASISSTLQATSRYGSDSLLNSGEATSQGNTSGSSGEKTSPSTSPGGGELKISARGELEKIRAAHCKDSGMSDPVVSSSASSSVPNSLFPLTQTTRSDQHSTPRLYSAPSSINSTPYRSGAAATARAKQQFNGGLSASRMAASLDGLQRRNTQVTYDVKTQAHILRSLV